MFAAYDGNPNGLKIRCPDYAIGDTMTAINIEVQKTIHRPIAVVSRQFGDMQHHSRDRVHPEHQVHGDL